MAWRTILTCLLLSFASAAGASDGQLTVSVRVDNRADVPELQLLLARREAERIYASASVRLTWMEERSARTSRPRLVVTVLTGLPANELVPANDPASGMLRLGLALPMARRAYVHYDRVKAIADRSHSDRGVLLGRVLAHELYHVMCRSHDHSESGLMAAVMNPRDRTPRLTSVESRDARAAVAQLAGNER